MTNTIDIVDEKDEVTSQEKRTKAHEENLLHRSVHVLIFDSEGNVVSQLRNERKDVFPLHWSSSAAGHLQSGENPNIAAERELEEELGIDTDLEFLGKFRTEDEEDEEFIYVFYGEHPGPYKISEEAKEIAEYDIDYILENPDNLDIDPHFKETLNYFMEHADHYAAS